MTHATTLENAHRGEPPRGVGVTSNRWLWFAAFGGAAAWSVDELVAFAWHEDYCASRNFRGFETLSTAGSRWLMIGIGIVTLVITAWSLYVGWRARGILGIDDGQDHTDLDRRRFMATWGLVANVLFLFGIALRVIAVIMLSPDLCGR
ncbi:MAG TPA: hypothetical protein VHB25_13765 [Gemmatimonadaceae bacterium]|nr:hypothetical protein [Gemmatimonadaceae bacterium]